MLGINIMIGLFDLVKIEDECLYVFFPWQFAPKISNHHPAKFVFSAFVGFWLKQVYRGQTKMTTTRATTVTTTMMPTTTTMTLKEKNMIFWWLAALGGETLQNMSWHQKHSDANSTWDNDVDEDEDDDDRDDDDGDDRPTQFQNSFQWGRRGAR